MAYRLQDLIDIEHFQHLQDRLNAIYSFPSAIIDNEGGVLTATAWQDICTQFHRKHEDCLKECIKSDQYILSHLQEANPAVSYRCPHGLVDNATPIIIDGIHYGNFFTGQFFLEEPDMDFFRAQAHKFGFDEDAYLAAVKQVPIWTQEQLNNYLFFIKGLIAVIAESGLKAIKDIEAIAERKRAEEQLRQASAFNKAILETLDGLIVVLDRQGGIVRFNAACERVTGWRADEVVGRRVWEILIPQEQCDGVRAAFAKLAAGMFPVLHENDWLARDGSRRWIAWANSVLTDTRGDVEYVIGTGVDITERKRAEAALRESEERYRALFDRSLDCVFLTDFQGNFLDANQAALDLLGYRREDIASVTFASLLTADQLLSAYQATEEIKATGHMQHRTEYRLRRKDGGQVFVETQSSLIYRDGKPFAIQGIARDITDRKRAEAAQRESEERFRTLVESAPEAVSVQAEDRFVYLNPAMLRLLGASRPEELLGTEFMDRMAPECRDAIRERVRVQRETGKPAPLMDQEYLRLDGSRVPVETSAVAIRFQGNDAHLVFVRDITERKRAEEERQALEAQYRQAQKMEAVGRLAAGVAHDFNNQLTVIQGYSEMLLSKLSEGDPAWDSLMQIQQAAKRAQSTTNHLLSFSRKQMLEAEVVDLGEFLRESEKPISRMIGEDVKLVVAAAPDMPVVLIDKSGLHQALMNLVVNARDAMPEGGRLILRTAGFHLASAEAAAEFHEAAPGGYVLLEVIDSGTGMDSQTLERVFDPFFTTKERGKGTGLGLPMVMGFIRQSGGFVGVRSEPGQGTAVRLLLPMARHKAEADKSRRAPAEAGKPSCKTLMVVEDEDGVRGFVVSALESAGYHVLAAPGPTEALKLSEEYEGPIDLVISDMVMSEMRGDELAKRLKASRRGLQVLFVTGYAEQGADLGGSILRKPFKVDDLLERVQSLLNRRGPGRQRKSGP